MNGKPARAVMMMLDVTICRGHVVDADDLEFCTKNVTKRGWLMMVFQRLAKAKILRRERQVGALYNKGNFRTFFMYHSYSGTNSLKSTRPRGNYSKAVSSSCPALRQDDDFILSFTATSISTPNSSIFLVVSRVTNCRDCPVLGIFLLYPLVQASTYYLEK